MANARQVSDTQQGLFQLCPPSLDDPGYWRKGAQRLRDLAAQISDEKLKEQILQLADEFDCDAKRAEQQPKLSQLGN